MSDKLSREQQYLAYLAGDATTYPQDPYTRTELYLYKICQNGGSGGGVTPEEIQQAVDAYLDEHPSYSEQIIEAVVEHFTENPMPAVVSKKS